MNHAVESLKTGRTQTPFAGCDAKQFGLPHGKPAAQARAIRRRGITPN